MVSSQLLYQTPISGKVTIRFSNESKCVYGCESRVTVPLKLWKHSGGIGPSLVLLIEIRVRVVAHISGKKVSWKSLEGADFYTNERDSKST
ncbi:hypothetical protein DX932_29715 [Bacillus cereus]|uniref:Uncharacterized protein n=1 Tax=Bacillus cereus TaxID=1396 RepID=A0A9W7PZR4_BACCE|nr:hypothetical protein DX932_29715 [Bacillus cereus]